MEQTELKKTGKEMKNKILGIIKNVASIPDDEVNYWAALSTFVILILGGICTLMRYFPALGGIVIFAALAPFIIINLIRRYWAPALRCYSVICMNLTGKPEAYEVGVMAKDASAAAECAKKSLAEGRHIDATVVNVTETNTI